MSNKTTFRVFPILTISLLVGAFISYIIYHYRRTHMTPEEMESRLFCHDNPNILKITIDGQLRKVTITDKSFIAYFAKSCRDSRVSREDGYVNGTVYYITVYYECDCYEFRSYWNCDSFTPVLRYKGGDAILEPKVLLMPVESEMANKLLIFLMSRNDKAAYSELAIEDGFVFTKLP